MARAFGIWFIVFTQMEDDPTVKTNTPTRNTCTERVATLCVILRQLPQKFLPYILVNIVYCL
jgi:hypothetical protein